MLCGEAGDIVITGRDNELREPRRDMKTLLPDEHDNTIMVETNRLMFADDDRGDKKYEKICNSVQYAKEWKEKADIKIADERRQGNER